MLSGKLFRTLSSSEFLLTIDPGILDGRLDSWTDVFLGGCFKMNKFTWVVPLLVIRICILQILPPKNKHFAWLIPIGCSLSLQLHYFAIQRISNSTFLLLWKIWIEFISNLFDDVKLSPIASNIMRIIWIWLPPAHLIAQGEQRDCQPWEIHKPFIKSEAFNPLNILELTLWYYLPVMKGLRQMYRIEWHERVSMVSGANGGQSIKEIFIHKLMGLILLWF